MKTTNGGKMKERITPQQVKEQRKLRAVTQTSLSMATGIAQPTISRYENGQRNMSNKKKALIADALKMSKFPPGRNVQQTPSPLKYCPTCHRSLGVRGQFERNENVV